MSWASVSSTSQFGRQYFKQCTATSDQSVCKHVKLAVRHMFTFMSWHCSPHFLLPLSLACAHLGPESWSKSRQGKVTELKESLAMGKKLEVVTKYFILLPTVEAHQNYHPTSGAAGIRRALQVHPWVIDKINTLVGEGTTNIQEVKRALRHHVMHVFFFLTLAIVQVMLMTSWFKWVSSHIFPKPCFNCIVAIQYKHFPS